MVQKSMLKMNDSGPYLVREFLIYTVQESRNCLGIRRREIENERKRKRKRKRKRVFGMEMG
jgi:hypothetical protein